MPTVTIHDPRYVDGEPYEVAAVAGDQLEQAIQLSQEAYDGLVWAARGAWLTAEEYRTGSMPEGKEFENTAQHRNLDQIGKALAVAEVSAKNATIASGWNPRSYL